MKTLVWVNIVVWTLALAVVLYVLTAEARMRGEWDQRREPVREQVKRGHAADRDVRVIAAPSYKRASTAPRVREEVEAHGVSRPDARRAIR